MLRYLKGKSLIVLLAGAAPLATVATCNETGPGAHVWVSSSNSDLLEDVLDLLSCDDCDEDDD
jgi:hypothetical protein